jgi:hypothetical protein
VTGGLGVFAVWLSALSVAFESASAASAVFRGRVCGQRKQATKIPTVEAAIDSSQGGVNITDD